MKQALTLAATLSLATALHAAGVPKAVTSPGKKPDASATAAPDKGVLFQPEQSETSGTVAIEGKKVDYRAVAGTMIVHPEGWDDAAWREQSDKDLDDKKDVKAEASMFYVAYFKKGAPSADRPITFLYNGGPGSSTVWLHMGAFGPRRVVTKPTTATHPPRPIAPIDNAYSLLDASDLVFIDAPGTGFARIAGKDKEKAFSASTRRLRLRRVHHGLPVQVRPLELAQISVRRKLRHAALGGRRQRARNQ